MIVLKFGGTSIGSPERMKSILPLIKREEKCLVVLSAFSGVTNTLIQISTSIKAKDLQKAKEQIDSLEELFIAYQAGLFANEQNRLQAMGLIDKWISSLTNQLGSSALECDEHAILSCGESISSAFFQLLLRENKMESALLSALDFMRLQENKEPDMDYIAMRLTHELAQHPDKQCLVTQGFICKDAQGKISNLKRGGSDYTATLIGAAIKATEVEIWTDIDGMHNNDPRCVDHTRSIAKLSFEEAGELAYFGAKILHPSSIAPAQKAHVPVRLKNTLKPEAQGTLISNESIEGRIKAIAAKDGITAIKIKSDRMLLAHGFLKEVFEIFGTYQTPIDMITTSEVAISLTIDDPTHLEEIRSKLQLFSAVEVDTDLTIVCIVGDFIADHKGYGVEIFSALREVPIRMVSYGGSKHNVSVLVRTMDKNEALNSLHKALFS